MLLARAAAAQEAEPAGTSAIIVEGCPKSLVTGLERLIDIELRSLSEAALASDVRLSCKDGGVVIIEVSEGGRFKNRKVNLDDTDRSVRARVMALTLRITIDRHTIMNSNSNTLTFSYVASPR